ncbi:MAG TPA: YezD family protein [Candidatus Binataceae bacterium]|nr:YezD family protein [Candidatus Binataceae bacterium]
MPKPAFAISKSDAEPVASDHLVSLTDIDAEVIRAIRNIRYGSVEITIHDSRVVQIERKEKRRFEVSQRVD